MEKLLKLLSRCERCFNFQINIGHPSKNTRIEEPLILSKPAGNTFSSLLGKLTASLWKIVSIQD